MKTIVDAIVELKNWRKDETLRIRFYTGTGLFPQSGSYSDVWIDGLSWLNYDCNMQEYLHEEYGIDIPDGQTFDVIESSDDFITRTCFNSKGLFSCSQYEYVNDALVDFEEEVIEAAISLGIRPDSLSSDMYRGKFNSFVDFATDLFNDCNLMEIPESLREFIDYEKYAESLEQQYLYADGHVFDATYR